MKDFIFECKRLLGEVGGLFHAVIELLFNLLYFYFLIFKIMTH